MLLRIATVGENTYEIIDFEIIENVSKRRTLFSFNFT